MMQLSICLLWSNVPMLLFGIDEVIYKEKTKVLRCHQLFLNKNLVET